MQGKRRPFSRHESRFQRSVVWSRGPQGFLLIWWCIPCAHSHLDISGLSRSTLSLCFSYTTKYALYVLSSPSPYPSFTPTSLRLLVRDIVIHYSILQHHEFPWDDIRIVCFAAPQPQQPVLSRCCCCCCCCSWWWWLSYRGTK